VLPCPPPLLLLLPVPPPVGPVFSRVTLQEGASEPHPIVGVAHTTAIATAAMARTKPIRFILASSRQRANDKLTPNAESDE
jgi:hypothetical protein